LNLAAIIASRYERGGQNEIFLVWRYYRLGRGVDPTHTRKRVKNDIALQRQIPEREMDIL
jgi:hypothetical protein